MKVALTYLLLGFLWLLHWLPLPALRWLGKGLGRLLYAFGDERRNVALTNLRLCFPDKTEAEREALARQHFIVFAQSAVDRTLGWWASKERLQRLIRIRGLEILTESYGQPTILLSAHFVGLDAGATRITMDVEGCNIYSRQKNKVFERVMQNGRKRFKEGVQLSRQDGMRKIIKAIKAGYPLYYFSDMDYGPEESIFVPFFGVQAATITGVSRLARLTGARVVVAITRLVEDGYEVEVMPPWQNFPGESVEADTEFVNRFIESQVLRMPEQYFWVHKRFKTRPPGEQRFYQ
ncbi:MAG: lipid biosynthesis acyltransferase [Proteobacteria bacterium]|nr:lipid biosynthesis acyltransferase [Pseudomonadota bacterium]